MLALPDYPTYPTSFRQAGAVVAPSSVGTGLREINQILQALEHMLLVRQLFLWCRRGVAEKRGSRILRRAVLD